MYASRERKAKKIREIRERERENIQIRKKESERKEKFESRGLQLFFFLY